MAIQPIPEGFHTVTPYLILNDAGAALEFYGKALGAKERFRMPMPDGSIGHAEILIGNSIVMLASEFPTYGCHSARHYGGSPIGLTIYTEDADAAFDRAVEAGASVHEPMENKFYGERAGTVEDPFGYRWTFMTHIEDLTPEEMQRRMDAESAKMGG